MRMVELHPSQVVFLCPARKALVLGSPVNLAFSGHLVEDTGGLAEKPLQGPSYSDFTVAGKTLIAMMGKADMAEPA